jgi:hypothetical protein
MLGKKDQPYVRIGPDLLYRFQGISDFPISESAISLSSVNVISALPEPICVSLSKDCVT